jgi:LPXTG-motif cell wall-anchored protein
MSSDILVRIIAGAVFLGMLAILIARRKKSV